MLSYFQQRYHQVVEFHQVGQSATSFTTDSATSFTVALVDLHTFLTTLCAALIAHLGEQIASDLQMTNCSV